MACVKCDVEEEDIKMMKEYFERNCICDILIYYGNCERCLYHGEYCVCTFEYAFDSDEMKKSLSCPIGWGIFIDPVIASDGHTYERKNIEDWFMNSDKSPMTGSTVNSKELYPNYLIKSILKNCKKIYK